MGQEPSPGPSTILALSLSSKAAAKSLIAEARLLASALTVLPALLISWVKGILLATA